MLSFTETVFKKLLIVTGVAVVLFLCGDAIGKDDAAELGVVASARLNVRLKPDKNSRSIGTLKKDKLVRIVRHTDNGWLEIAYDNKDGFIRNRKKYVHVFRKKTKKKIKRAESSVNAQADVDKKIEKHTTEIAEIDRKIKKHSVEIHEFSKKETVIINGLNEIDRALNQSRQKLASIKRELSHLEAEIKNNKNALKDLKLVIKNNERYIERRLVSLYKLNQIGKMNVLASADSIFELLNRKNSMRIILESDAEILDSHLDNLSRLSGLLNRLSEQKSSKISLKNDYSSQINIIEQNKSKRRALLVEIREKKSLGLAAIESLKEAAEALNQTIDALDQGFERGKGDGDTFRSNFISRKGLMRMPVKGKITTFFGKATDSKFLVETFHSGIKVNADRGEPVQAVSAGEVLFADWLKGYGNLIIINHGNNYYSLYGHTEELFKQKGDLVEEREVIATVGDTGSLTGSGLHFEIRHRGQPVDPLIWLSKG